MPKAFILAGVLSIAAAAGAEIDVNVSDDLVTLDNGLVRVELPRDANFHPAVLLDKTNPGGGNLLDYTAFSFWDSVSGDWHGSNTFAATPSTRVSSSATEAWFETTLTLPGAEGADRLTLRTTLPAGQRAVKLDFWTNRGSDRLRGVALRVGSHGYTEATWAARGENRTSALSGSGNLALFGFDNYVALTRPQAAGSEGVVMYLNEPWGYYMPS